MIPVLLNGTSLWVSTSKPLTQTVSGFEMLAYTQVRGFRLLGDITKQWETRQTETLDLEHQKTIRTGSYKLTPIQLELYKLNDLGQSIVSGAIDSPSAYSYKIQRPNGTGHYFNATAIMQTNQNGDSSAANIMRIELAFDSDLLDF